MRWALASAIALLLACSGSGSVAERAAGPAAPAPVCAAATVAGPAADLLIGREPMAHAGAGELVGGRDAVVDGSWLSDPALWAGSTARSEEHRDGPDGENHDDGAEQADQEQGVAGQDLVSGRGMGRVVDHASHQCTPRTDSNPGGAHCEPRKAAAARHASSARHALPGALRSEPAAIPKEHASAVSAPGARGRRAAPLAVNAFRQGRWCGRRGEPPQVQVQRGYDGVTLVSRERDRASALRACERALAAAAELGDAAARDVRRFLAAELGGAERHLAAARAEAAAFTAEHGDVQARAATASRRLAVLRQQHRHASSARQRRVAAEIATLQQQALELDRLSLEAGRLARSLAAAEAARRALLERARRAASSFELVQPCAIRSCPN